MSRALLTAAASLEIALGTPLGASACRRPVPASPTPALGERPAVRSSFGLVFDDRRRRLVLFGGSDSAFGRLGDTWEWAAGRWTRVAIDGPEPRAGFAMTYDAARGRTIVFGGRTASGLMRDTWEYDGRRWTRADTSGPSPRQLTAMAYDAARRRTVLFSGSTASGPATDTWEWDGTRWSAMSAIGPPPRGSHALVYDAVRRRVVLVGGYAGDAALADVWEWDGAAWTHAGDGPAVFHSAAAFDARSGRLLVFGGFEGDGRSDRLWARGADGAWAVVEAAGPPARAEHRGTLVPGAGFVVFGGIGGQGMTLEERGRAKLGDLWTFDGVRWRALDVPATRPQAAAPNGPAQWATIATELRPIGVTAAMVALGDSLFHVKSCRKCHGMDAGGGTNAPSLVAGRWLQTDGGYAGIVRVVTDGVPLDAIRDSTHTLDMHPRGGSNLDDAQIAAIAAYVWTISRGKR